MNIEKAAEKHSGNKLFSDLEESNLFEIVWKREFDHVFPGWGLKCGTFTEESTVAATDKYEKMIIVGEDVWTLTHELIVIRILAHEAAHILDDSVCDSHSVNWRQLCIDLGGNGRVVDYIPSLKKHELLNRMYVMIHEKADQFVSDITQEQYTSFFTEIMGEMVSEGHNQEDLMLEMIKYVTSD
jgi:hypothetical protein